MPVKVVICPQTETQYNVTKTPIGKGRTQSGQLGTSQEAVDRMVNIQVRGDMLRWSWYATSKENFPEALETARPLHIAAYKGHLPIVRMLLAYGAFVDCEDTNLATPLHYALYNSQRSMVQPLLEAGANPNAVDSRLNSPCIIAAEHDEADALRILLEGGADIQLRNWYGETIFHVAAFTGAKNIFVSLWNDATMHYLGTEDARRQTILLEAVCNTSIPMNYLVNLAPSAGAYESREYNILGVATTYRSTAEVRMLLHRTPTECLTKFLNYRAPVGGTPLYIAAIMSKLDTMTLLLDFGAQLEVEGSEHGTPLMAACATGRLAAVKFLVARGASTSYVKDGQVYSAFIAAKYHPKVKRWLLVGRFSEGPKLLKQRTKEGRSG